MHPLLALCAQGLQSCLELAGALRRIPALAKLWVDFSCCILGSGGPGVTRLTL